MPRQDDLSTTMRIDLPPEALEPGSRMRVAASRPTGRPNIAPTGERLTRPPVGESDFQELLQSVYDAALLCDEQGHILDVNIRALSFLRRERDDLCRGRILDVISGAGEDLLDAIQEGLGDNRFVLIQAYCLRRDNGQFPAEISVNRLQLRAQTYLCFFIRDITLRKVAEEQLRAENNAIQNAATGIAMTDLEARVQFTNPALLAILGAQTPGELLGADLDSFMHDAPTADRILRTILQGGSWVGELALRRCDNSSFFGQISVAPNFNVDSEIAGMVISVLDVTERRQTEERLHATMTELARSNSELEQFAYVVSHDLQEPLRKITAFGDLLKSQFSDALPEGAQDYVGRMQAAASRMQGLIRDLLTLSRVSTRAQPFSLVDLNETVAGVLSDLETRIEQSGGRVEVGALPVIEAERIQMRQLFQNLIVNALKFHLPGVAPQVRLFAREAPETSDESCEIVVEDNGIGIPPDETDRIFGVFQRLHSRREYEGAGIGLAVCRKIAERHGGSIRVEENAGQGARFIVVLPRRHSPASASGRLECATDGTERHGD